MRPTKLSRFCDGLMEAGWLAALALAPLFYNTYSSRVFEPDKIALVRSIALIVAAAWIGKWAESFSRDRQSASLRDRVMSFARQPLVLPVTLLLGAYFIATVFSITPRTSLWGSYTRQQGLYTLLAYLTVFAAIAANMRRREQVDRLITTVILTSLPVSLYGIIQRLKIDPMPWVNDAPDRVTSTLGNAIFIAAYLIMAVPLTAMRIVQSFHAVLRDTTSVGRSVARAAVYVFTGAMQLLAIWYSGSRGPWLGLLAGMFFWAVLLSLVLKQRRVTLAILIGAGAMAAFLITLNIPNGPLEPLRNTQYLGRLGRVFEVDDGTSKVRVLIWQGAAKMALPHEPIQFPDGTPDRLNILRPLVGYGPESIYVAYNRFYSPEIAHYERRNATPDRSHNETFDALLTSGALGLVAYFAMFAAAIYYGLKWLGLITPGDKWLYVGLYVGGGVLGAAMMIGWRGPAYFGVGLPFGALVGLLAYLAFLALTRTLPEIDQWRALILTAMLGGIVAHFTEIHFGIAVVSTRLHFWASVGVLMVVGWIMATQKAEAALATSSAETNATTRKGRRRRQAPPPTPVGTNNAWAAIFPPVLAGLMLITLTYDFLSGASGETSIINVLIKSLTTVHGQPGLTAYGMPILFVTVWLCAAIMLGDDLRSIILTLGTSFAIWLGFALYHGTMLTTIAERQLASQPLEGTLDVFTGLYTGFGIWVVVMIMAMAATLVTEWSETAATGTTRLATAAIAVVAALATGYMSNTRSIQADMLYKIAVSWDNRQQWDMSIPMYERAIALAPFEDQYYLFLGRAYLGLTATIPDRVERTSALKDALSKIEAAQKLNPLLPDHAANLARLSKLAAQTVPDSAEAAVYADDADDYYAQALRLAPNSVDLWNEWTRFDLTVRQDYQGALEKLQTSISLDDQFNDTYLLLGDCWTLTGNNETDAIRQRTDYEKAAGYYRQAIAAEGPDTPQSLNARLSLGDVELRLGDWDAAIATYEDLLQYATEGGDIWVVYNSLAQAYLNKGDKATALDYASLALNTAPEGRKAEVQALIDTLGK